MLLLTIVAFNRMAIKAAGHLVFMVFSDPLCAHLYRGAYFWV